MEQNKTYSHPEPKAIRFLKPVTYFERFSDIAHNVSNATKVLWSEETNEIGVTLTDLLEKFNLTKIDSLIESGSIEILEGKKVLQMQMGTFDDFAATLKEMSSEIRMTENPFIITIRCKNKMETYSEINRIFREATGNSLGESRGANDITLEIDGQNYDITLENLYSKVFWNYEYTHTMSDYERAIRLGIIEKWHSPNKFAEFKLNCLRDIKVKDPTEDFKWIIETSDGKQFTDEKEANDHQQKLTEEKRYQWALEDRNWLQKLFNIKPKY